MYGSFVLHCFIHQCHLMDDVCTDMLNWERTYVPRYLCSPVPMFPGTYVPRYLCSPVPMFPGTYVPRYLCSPVPMFLEPMFPSTSETDYDVIKYNHMSAQTGILNSLVTRVFCPVQTTPT